MSAPGGSRLAERHVFVTGAGTGIGRAIARRLAGEGALVSLAARGVDRLGEAAREILAAGGAEPFVTACDVRERGALDEAMA